MEIYNVYGCAHMYERVYVDIYEYVCICIYVSFLSVSAVLHQLGALQPQMAVSPHPVSGFPPPPVKRHPLS